MSDQQHEQAPKKRHRFRTIIFAFAAVIAVIAIAGALGGGGSDGTTASSDKADTSTSDQPAKAKKKTPGIGDSARDGKFQFTVTAVKPGVDHVGGQYARSNAQGEYVIVSVTVENVGDKAQTLDSSSQLAYDAKGREFSADGGAGISLDSQMFLNGINPGNSVKGKLVFDVPKGAVLTRLELHDSPFSGGVEVDL